MSDVMEWQPIETAPKDGTRIILYAPHSLARGGVVCGSWNDDRFAKNPRPFWTHDLVKLDGLLRTCEFPPTHWMALPAAPKGGDV